MTREVDFVSVISEFNRSILMAEGEDDLPDMIHGWFKQREPDKRTGLHVSDFADPCLRRLMYKVTEPDVRDPAPDYASAKIFEAGNAIHDRHHNVILGPMGILKGKWECSRCGKIVDGYRPKEPCDGAIDINGPFDTTISCASVGMDWRYKELGVTLNIEGREIVGHTDGIITVRGEDRVLEMKSKDSELFEALTKPEPKHVVQASIYAVCLHLNKITILYVEKNKWVYKAYTMDTALWAFEWLRDSVKTLNQLLESGDPTRVTPKCANKNAARAKRCAYRLTCFPK